MMSFLDVTYLESSTDNHVLATLCDKIKQSQVLPAGICVFLRDLAFVKQQLAKHLISFVTVANFPDGRASYSQVHSQLNEAKILGALEVDVVIPYQTFLEDRDFNAVAKFVELCRSELSHQKLKIILESGALANDDVYRLSKVACENGADFIKTSTGKISVGATLPAVEAIIKAIKEHTARPVGLKVSGGVRTKEQAQSYLDCVTTHLGSAYHSPALFRIGASTLFEALSFTQ
ncbi:MAG: deoxyribose-phosphate aldolase [Candidatus Berkiella sp.]